MEHFFYRFLWGFLFLSALSQCALLPESKFVQKAGPVRFGIISDVQYGDFDKNGRRYYRNSLKKLNQCLDTLKTGLVPFIIDLGDLIEADFRSFKPVRSIYSQSKIRLYHTLGNHDFKIDSTLVDSVDKFLGMPSRYYSFSPFKGYLFIILDGTDISLFGRSSKTVQYSLAKMYLDSLKNKNLINAKKWNGGLGQSQLNWVDSLLKKADSSGTHVLIFNHFPIYPPNQHNLFNSDKLLSVLLKYKCVMAYFSGHNHNGHYINIKHIHFIGMEALVETPHTTSCAMVSLQPNKLMVNGIGRQKDFNLPLMYP